jgi:hypothetical protein
VNFWKEFANRRKYFVQFAEKNGFDPLVPENWYSAIFAADEPVN